VFLPASVSVAIPSKDAVSVLAPNETSLLPKIAVKEPVEEM
jgi:hypothetical protein